MTAAVSLCLLLALCALALGELQFCKKRVLVIKYRAGSAPVPINLYRACPTENGAFNCGGPWATNITVSCTEAACSLGTRCNTCVARVRPRQLPRYYHTFFGLSKLGKYRLEFQGHQCPIAVISSDFENAGPDWFKRNGFQAGCVDRVGCLPRNIKCVAKGEPLDLAVYVQGCGARLYRPYKNAKSFRDCRRGNVVSGTPPGEVIGTDCPARRI